MKLKYKKMNYYDTVLRSTTVQYCFFKYNTVNFIVNTGIATCDEIMYGVDYTTAYSAAAYSTVFRRRRARYCSLPYLRLLYRTMNTYPTVNTVD